MAVTLTETAAEHVKAFMENRGKGVALRLGVRTSGCSGMAYVLEFADSIEPQYKTFESHGVTVVVDAKSLVSLDGTELDGRPIKVNVARERSREGGRGAV